MMKNKKCIIRIAAVISLFCMAALAQPNVLEIHKTDQSVELLPLSGIDYIAFGQGCVADIDGNIYTAVQIGDQCWTVENLRVTHFRNGDPIAKAENSTEWGNMYGPGYCCCNNNENNSETYGYLYNWSAVHDSRDIAPEGWHVANIQEMEILREFLGGTNVAGGKLKEAGTEHWAVPNAGATNESGFTALPGGYCNSDGNFSGMGEQANFWTESFMTVAEAYSIRLYAGTGELDVGPLNKQCGCSVRLVKD